MNCSNDDSAACCGLCHYKPVVVIATHNRTKITTENISLLNKMQIKPHVICVTSANSEVIHFRKHFPDITIGITENRPLGKKWQAGITHLENERTQQYNPLIILGSDDLLHPDYIKKSLRMIQQGYDLIGLTSWYSYDVARKKLYLTEYVNKNKDFPIGSGKVYSKRILDKMKYRVFDEKLDRRLDDFGYYSAQKLGAKIGLIREPMVLAVKGKWNELNPIERYLNSPNIKAAQVSTDILKEFGYQ